MRIKNPKPIVKSHPIQSALIILGSLLITCLALAITYIFINLNSLPKVNRQELTTYAPTKIVDKNGDPIWENSQKQVIPITYGQIPSLYRKALIATENENFFKENGYSPVGVTNAVVTTVLSKFHLMPSRGGSTIDQQLIKNVYFNGGRDIQTTTRKIQEIFLAKQLNHNFTKKQILTFYVNNLEFAENAQGVAAAMKVYFGKDPSDYSKMTTQNIAEQAYLAGLGQAPSTYNLYTNPALAAKRKNIVLGIMLNHNLITKKQYRAAVKYDLTKNLKPRLYLQNQQLKSNLKYKAYTDQVLRDLTNMGYDLSHVSMTVHTYLDPKVFDEVTNKVRQNNYYQDENQEVAATVIDKRGVVVAMVGSRKANSELNRAIQTTRSSGSSLKPFTAYGPLLTYFGNNYNTASRFDASPYRYPGTNTYMYNYGKENPGMVTMTNALRMSYNTPVGRIADTILGSMRMKTFLSGVGLDVKDSYSSVDAIGLDVSTLQAAAAYHALDNHGVYAKPRLIKSLTFSDGSVKTISPESKQAMPASVAYVLLQMLRGVVTSQGTAPAAAISNYSGYAAKTGTVAFAGTHANQKYGEGGSDAWFNSVTRSGYAISIWTGYDQPQTSPAISDNYTGHDRLGRDLQTMLNGTKTISNWTQPSGVVKISGTNLSAQYRVTGSHDVDSQMNIQTANSLTQFKNLLAASKLETSVDPGDWTSKLTNNDFFNYYQNHQNLDKNVISSDLYNLLKGGD